MLTNFKPINDRVLIEPIDLGEQKKGNILIPDLGEEKVRVGKVISTGPGSYQFGKFIENSIAPGTVVILPKIGAMKTEIDGKEYWVIAEREIIATAEIKED